MKKLLHIHFYINFIVWWFCTEYSAVYEFYMSFDMDVNARPQSWQRKCFGFLLHCVRDN
ncbi:MAG: hypothetical protein FWE63_05570 [Bacteroidales bacterium]|nr:hypothetical protein [Bacteroidales bacterium]